MCFGNSVKIFRGSVPVVSLLLAGNYKQLDIRKVRWVLQDHVEGQAKYMNQSGFSIQMTEKMCFTEKYPCGQCDLISPNPDLWQILSVQKYVS